jgi:uncharacterized protein YggU (UPF0235/DUF167 family)
MLPVRAHAGGRRNGIAGQQDGMLKVSVTQAAEKGKANRAILGVLCDELSLRKSQVELLAGDTSPQKRFLVRDLPMEELRQRIDAALARFRPRRA